MTPPQTAEGICENCKRIFGKMDIFGFKIEKADARSVCDQCNEIEEIEQAKELGEWNISNDYME